MIRYLITKINLSTLNSSSLISHWLSAVLDLASSGPALSAELGGRYAHSPIVTADDELAVLKTGIELHSVWVSTASGWLHYLEARKCSESVSRSIGTRVSRVI